MSITKMELSSLKQVKNANFSAISESKIWNTGDEKELSIHKIHAYPAKFPAFITTKALRFAESQGIEPRRIADIFCGCGTVAYEARRNGIDFWGCDINPVATLIAKTKSTRYDGKKLQTYYTNILATYKTSTPSINLDPQAIERLSYWFSNSKLKTLAKLKNAIDLSLPSNSHYKTFFYCAFSNILKPASKWLTKSIKPQIDPDKKPSRVLTLFRRQCEQMISAYSQSESRTSSKVEIVTGNFLEIANGAPKVDLIVTSPPYVTSYEYADLHQLSSLWLGYTDDYRKLRNGSIGSSQLDFNFNKEVKNLNQTGSEIVFKLFEKDTGIAKSVAKYFLDMQSVSSKCSRLLSKKGIAVFVIGNTEYRGVKVDNAKHLSESLLESGFKEVLIEKRKISNKFLTPFRDKKGCFSNKDLGKQIYGQEYIVIAKK